MNRAEFLKTYACGLCGCAAIGVLTPDSLSSAETPAAPHPAEDWRFQFIRQRYAKLLENLANRVGTPALTEILQQQGRYCASLADVVVRNKGDIDGYIQTVTREWKQEITYDRARGVIIAAGPEVKECFCPLIDKGRTPKSACDCSIGWTQYAYETVLGKKVQVELKESLLRGGKRCVFEVRMTGGAT